jgi:pimeloyl-ACP methyl ester carboxylesterase
MMLSFDLASPPDAPAVVFLHGAAFTRHTWLPQMEALADEFRLIALDLSGHGQLAGQPFRLADAARQVADVVDAHASGRALLVGLSLGGYVAVSLAHWSPARAAGLVLFRCSANYRGTRGSLLRLNALLLAVYPERWLTRLNARTLRRMLPPDLAAAQIATGFSWRAAGQGFKAIAGADPRTWLRAYPGPVLVLNGEDDRPNRAREAVLVAVAPRATLGIIPRAGHGCNLEQAEAFSAAVRDFARAHGGMTRASS